MGISDNLIKEKNNMFGSLLRHLSYPLVVYLASADFQAQVAAAVTSAVAIGVSFLEKKIKKHL